MAPTPPHWLFTQTGTYTSRNPPARWPLSPAVLDLLSATGRGLPSAFTYLNFGKVKEEGVELSLDARVNDNITALANYSWQAEPEPEGFDISELNLPPTHRFNAGFDFSRGRYFGNLSMSFTDHAFWQDVLDVRFHGRTDSYTLVNSGFGVRSTDGKMSVIFKVTNLFNAAVQQHVFGDVIKRFATSEVRLSF